MITGTDTGVGKTHVAAALLAAARARGIAAVGYKPVASGSRLVAEGLRNEDALALIEACGADVPYASVNPYTFEPAIAPHVAAAEVGVRIEPAVLDRGHAWLAERYELVIVEGAGGWYVPFGPRFTFADWIASHRWPTLLVVGLKLGSINHALLSAEAIMRRTSLLGWVGNRLPPTMEREAETVETLRRSLDAPMIGLLPEGVRPGRAIAGALLDGVLELLPP